METCFSSNVAGESPTLKCYMETRLKSENRMHGRYYACGLPHKWYFPYGGDRLFIFVLFIGHLLVTVFC